MGKPQDIFELLDETKRIGVSEENTYLRVTNFLEEKARETGTPYHGHFELTPLCNLDCKMCYVHLTEAQIQGKKLLPAETWIALMQQAINAGMAKAILSGGECLTYPQFDELFLFLKSKGIDITVMTNGVLLNQERIHFFKKYPPKGIQISLYGYSENSYELVTGKRLFYVVLHNIKAAKEADLPIRIMITPSKYMSRTVRNTICLARELDIPYFINSFLMEPRIETGRNQKVQDLTQDEYIDIFKFDQMSDKSDHDSKKIAPPEMNEETEIVCSGLRCGAGRSSFSVCWNGEMHPCVMMNSITANPIQEGFLAAWEAINREARLYPRFKKCDSCNFRNACTFCAAENEKRSSRYCLDHSWCERAWKMVQSGLKLNDQQCEEG